MTVKRKEGTSSYWEAGGRVDGGSFDCYRKQRHQLKLGGGGGGAVTKKEGTS